jgi:hypothetical protein
MSTQLQDFVEVWQRLDSKGKEKAIEFLMRAYGKNLFHYIVNHFIGDKKE